MAMKIPVIMLDEQTKEHHATQMPLLALKPRLDASQGN
jgi:hypothetical protein